MRHPKPAPLASAAALIVLTASLVSGPAEAAQKTVRVAGHAAANKPDDKAALTGRNPDGSLHMPVLGDAPKDDFERVAWCHGVLSGDMELAEMINPVLPTDEQLQLIGTSYLRAYEAALTLSGKGKTEAEHKKAEDARDYGYNEWATARKADLKEAAGLYVNWQLPGECEKAAVRLSGHPNLFAEMATDEEAEAIQAVMTSGGDHHDNAPAPVLTAQAASPGDGVVAANTLGRRVDLADALPKIQKPAQTAPSSKPKDDKRHWSEGLAYRLGWSNTPKDNKK